ncbi:MAG: hypothetical protein R2734_15135 [Nocardioides sp.]
MTPTVKRCWTPPCARSSVSMAGTGVIDIFAEARLEKPDISVIDDEFRRRWKHPIRRTSSSRPSAA